MKNRHARLLWTLLVLLLLSGFMYMMITAFRPTLTNIETFRSVVEATMTTRPCTLYYTNNLEECDAGMYIDNDKAMLLEKLATLNGSNVANLTETQKKDITSLTKVLADYDALPFKQQCKITLPGMSEATTHPYKIVKDTDSDKRGAPQHWAFCFADSIIRDHPTVVNNAPFQKVFKNSGLDVSFKNESNAPRYDFHTLYNDDIADLYCDLNKTLKLEANNNLGIFNGRNMLELSVNATGVITGVQAVVFQDGNVVKHSNPIPFYKSFLQVMKANNNFAYELRNFKPMVYKFVFDICPADKTLDLAADRTVKMIVSKQKPFITGFFRFPPVLLYDYTGMDISDLFIDTTVGDV